MSVPGIVLCLALQAEPLGRSSENREDRTSVWVWESLKKMVFVCWPIGECNMAILALPGKGPRAVRAADMKGSRAVVPK